MPIGAHYSIVAKNAAEIIGIREDIFLQSGKKNYRRSRPDKSLGCDFRCSDILGANDFLRRHREKRASFHGGVIGDEHERPSANFREASDGSRRGGAAPFLIHFVSSKNAKLKKL